jgi:hypothetical protein
MLNSSHLLELTLHNSSLFSQHHKIFAIKGRNLIHILLGSFYSVHRHVMRKEEREPQTYKLKLLVIQKNTTFHCFKTYCKSKNYSSEKLSTVSFPLTLSVAGYSMFVSRSHISRTHKFHMR